MLNQFQTGAGSVRKVSRHALRKTALDFLSAGEVSRATADALVTCRHSARAVTCLPPMDDLDTSTTQVRAQVIDAARGELTFQVLQPGLASVDPQRFERLFRQFESGYRGAFRGNEAEPTTEWRARIAGKAPPQPVMRIVVAIERDATGAERVVGGVATEYYRAGGCARSRRTCTCWKPACAARARRRLLDEARAACENLGPVNALLAEAEWPQALLQHGAPRAEVDEARERLLFFVRSGPACSTSTTSSRHWARTRRASSGACACSSSHRLAAARRNPTRRNPTKLPPPTTSRRPGTKRSARRLRPSSMSSRPRYHRNRSSPSTTPSCAA